jgi:hypothetical protein
VRHPNDAALDPCQPTDMTADFDQACVELDRSLFLRLADASGTTVRCLDGCLWVTRDGCLEDIELAPGQSYLVEDPTRVIVTAFGPSLACVSRPSARVRPAALQTLAAWLRHPWPRPVAQPKRMPSAAIAAARGMSAGARIGA